MTKMMTLLAAAGTAASMAAIGSATPAQAEWCPPAYRVAYYAPPPCCATYGYYPSLTYTTTLQYRPHFTYYGLYGRVARRHVRAGRR